MQNAGSPGPEEKGKKEPLSDGPKTDQDSAANTPETEGEKEEEKVEEKA